MGFEKRRSIAADNLSWLRSMSEEYEFNPKYCSLVRSKSILNLETV